MLSSTPGNATTTTVVTQTATATGSHSSPQSSSALFVPAASAHFAGGLGSGRRLVPQPRWCPNPDGAGAGPGADPPHPGAVLLRRGGAPGMRARTAGPGHGGAGGEKEEEEAAWETPQGHPHGRPSSLPHPSSRPRLVAAGLRRAGNQGAARRRRGAAARRAEVGRRVGTGCGGAGSGGGDPHGATPVPLPPPAPLSSLKVLWGRSSLPALSGLPLLAQRVWDCVLSEDGGRKSHRRGEVFLSKCTWVCYGGTRVLCLVTRCRLKYS